jgi:hypothetical protein
VSVSVCDSVNVDTLAILLTSVNVSLHLVDRNKNSLSKYILF